MRANAIKLSRYKVRFVFVRFVRACFFILLFIQNSNILVSNQSSNYANFKLKCFSEKVFMEICVATMSHTGVIQIKPPNFHSLLLPSFASYRKAIKKSVCRTKSWCELTRLKRNVRWEATWLSKQRANNFKLRSIIKLSRHCLAYSPARLPTR